MKIVASKNKKMLLPALLATGLVLIGIVILVMYLLNKPDSSQNQTKPGSNSINTPDESSNSDNVKERSAQTSNQIPVNNSASVSIDRLSQVGGQVILKATIRNMPTGGVCSVVFSNPNDKPVTNDSIKGKTENGVIVCEITQSEQSFTYLGNWTATFRYYADNQQVYATKDIIIR